jgi:vacuolar protein sorting-associated protein 13A/C
MDGATIFVSLSLSDDSWPFLIENDSSHIVTFCQAVSLVAVIRCCVAGLIIKQDATHTAFDSAKPYPTYRVPEHTSVPYAWDFPAARGKELLLTVNGSRRPVDILEIGDLVPFKFQVSEKHS